SRAIRSSRRRNRLTPLCGRDCLRLSSKRGSKKLKGGRRRGRLCVTRFNKEAYEVKMASNPQSAIRNPQSKIGLIAGNGRFPFLVLEGARAEGVEMAVAAIKEETDPTIENFAGTVEWVSVGHLGKLIKFFKREGVTRAIMAGQVKHVQIFKLNALP